MGSHNLGRSSHHNIHHILGIHTKHLGWLLLLVLLQRTSFFGHNIHPPYPPYG